MRKAKVNSVETQSIQILQSKSTNRRQMGLAIEARSLLEQAGEYLQSKIGSFIDDEDVEILDDMYWQMLDLIDEMSTRQG